MLENNINIFLIGPMGSGKTSIGVIIAKTLAKEFVDTDQEIEASTGVDISYIFDVEGESGFRKREEKLVASITQKKNIVLATGGGAIESENNRRYLASNGFVVYLETSIEDQVLRTTPNKKRPLLQNVQPKKRLQELMQKRKGLYESIADTIVNTEGHNSHSLAKQVIENFDAHRNS
jgi:shikimate kinase